MDLTFHGLEKVGSRMNKINFTSFRKLFSRGREMTRRRLLKSTGMDLTFHGPEKVRSRMN